MEKRTDTDWIADAISKAFYAVYNTLGYGFLEKTYENALVFELRSRGLQVQQQARIGVFYKGQQISEYFADLLVEGCVICELKAAKAICEEHEAQLLNYLKASKIELGFLLNFGPEPRIKRKIYDNWRK